MEYHVHTRYSQWHRLRVQLAGGLVAALLPYIIRLTMVMWNPGVVVDGRDGIAVLHVTGLVSLLAVLTGTMIMRSMANYPGVEGSSAILPAFSFTFGIALLIFVMARLEYNRFSLAGSYSLALLWFYFVYFKEQHRKLRIGVIATDDVLSSLVGVERIVPVVLSSPEQPLDRIDAIALDLRVDLPQEWERCLADHALAGVAIFHIKHLVESLTGRVALEHLSETSYGTLSPSSFYLTGKQMIDWLAAVTGGLLLLPILGLIALAIKLDSPGPVIFKQRRIGYRGQPFTVYKFRTMTHQRSLDAHRGEAITKDNDARITRIGGFLRQSRLDELAQIVNVMRGEMSWIGPRPEAEVLSRWYDKEIPFYRYRHIVRPGITGWAQVNQGHVAEITEVTSKLHYDFYYIKNFSPWIDLLIVARTIRTMLTGFGAR